MQLLAVVGGDPPLAATADRLDGRVAVVHAPAERGETRAAGTETTHAAGHVADEVAGPDGTDRSRRDHLVDEFELGADGAWRGTTRGAGPARLLDRLALDYDYALIGGTTRIRLPTVVAGDGPEPDAGRVVRRVEERPSAETLASITRDVDPYVTLETLVAETKRSADEQFAGAIATFTGRVRAKDDPADTRTTHLSFEKYERVAADRLAQIERELTSRDGVYDVRTHHRTGVVEAGEDIVFVVVLAGHRKEAFRAVSDGIDRLKDEVPIFKKEVTTEDAFWRHERGE